MPEPLRISGKQRTAQNLDTVDHIEDSSDKSHPAATPSYPTTPPPKPSSYAPSSVQTGPRSYGAPVSTPILKGGQ